MCNLYDIGPATAKQSRGWERQAVEALGALPKKFGVRRTDPGLVLRRAPGSDGLESVVMRWGFVRDFSNAINNSRVDKLGSGMWAAAWRETRCVIPVAAFYEWSGGEKGAKQTYALRGEPGEWLWMAGLWEENPDHGPCFSMITTEGQGVIASIHDRMPAILPADRVEAFLEAPVGSAPGELLDGLRTDLAMFPCLNPLKLPKPGPPVEDGFLF